MNTYSIGIITISDTRTAETDFSGQKIASLLTTAENTVSSRLVVKDDAYQINDAYDLFVDQKVDCIITNGGTGLAQRDVTFNTLHHLITQEIPGFGELFRYLSYLDIGTHAMASRALAGFNQSDQLIFCLPGSTKACQLAMEKLILPELDHLLKERRK